MSYASALAALERRQETRIELGLDRVRDHFSRLGYPHLRLRAIHVAGTNGKGSVCAILDSALRRAGHKTGFYLSPHLQDVRERLRVDGRWISPEDFERLLTRALVADRGHRLTYFELLTSVAFQWFAEQGVDAAVIETGLGGRLDATNVLERPLAAVITSIGLDHVQFLGPDLKSIAREKAGIVKPLSPTFCGDLPAAALAVVRARCREVGSRLAVVRRPYRRGPVDWAGNRQTLKDGRGRALSLGLLGARQAANAALAHAVLKELSAALPVPDPAWEAGLAAVSWPGRFEVRATGERRVVIDGAHNPQAAAALAETWKSCPWSKRPARWIVGVLRDKDARGILSPLKSWLKDVVVVAPPSPRALDAASLAAEIRRAAPRAKVSVASDVDAALARWEGEREGPATAVVCGSLYLAGQASRALPGGVRA